MRDTTVYVLHLFSLTSSRRTCASIVHSISVDAATFVRAAHKEEDRYLHGVEEVSSALAALEGLHKEEKKDKGYFRRL